MYFQITQDIQEYLFSNPTEGLQLIFSPYSKLASLSYNPLEVYDYNYERGSTWNFSRLLLIFNLLGGGSYLVTSILLSVTSFFGLWLGFISLTKLYKGVSKYMLVPFFLIPTAVIWSSGILKDTIVIGILGVFIFAFINLINKKKVYLSAGLLVFLFFILQVIKPILVIVLTLSIILWYIPQIASSIKKITHRIAIRLVYIFITLVVGYQINDVLVDGNSKYKIENLFSTLKGFQTFHSMDVFVEGQSNYTLGKVDYTFLGVFLKIPESLNVVFLRPYLWEVRNLPTLLGALESLVLFLFFIYIFYTVRIFFVRYLLSDRIVLFMIIFSLIYSIVVGISAYNFGALSRYKIPAIFMFMNSIVIIISYKNKFKVNRSK